MSDRSLDNPVTHESTCQSCEATIVWAVMETSGKRNPVDRQPDADGRMVVDAWQPTDKGVAPVMSVLKAAELEVDARPRYTSHFATCPNAAKHRKS